MKTMKNRPKEPGYYWLGDMIVKVSYTEDGYLVYEVHGNSTKWDISYVVKGLKWGNKIEK